MIDPKELRIDNLALYKTAKVAISAILPFGDVILNLMPTLPSWKVPCKHLAPIPITPELLTINMGFSTRTSGIVGVSCWEKGGFYINQKEDGKFYFTLCGKHVEVKYVHTLQNAFSFTGQELELKQPVTA